MTRRKSAAPTVAHAAPRPTATHAATTGPSSTATQTAPTGPCTTATHDAPKADRDAWAALPPKWTGSSVTKSCSFATAPAAAAHWLPRDAGGAA